MSKKIIALLIALIIVLSILIAYVKNSTNELFENKEVQYALGDIINKQKEVDREIAQNIKDKTYTLENAKVMVNPYELTPLTALIIFSTEKEESIEVEINGKHTTTSEKSKEHAIPIYGLYDGKDNIVRLTNSDKRSKEYTITTEAFEGDRLQVETTSEELDDSLYFLSPNFVENCIYDKNGNLLWYIKGDYAGDIRYLENGHFYISDPYQGTNGVKINYAGFLEMDYLGKIYKQFITPYGYHHEIVTLKDDRILTLGAKDDSPFLEGILYIFDSKTGEVEKLIDMYELLHNIAPKWVESLGSNFDFVLNSASYNEDTKDIVLSCRGIGVIMKLNLESEKIDWMFGDPKNLPDEFNKYLLKVTDNTKYPYGEHSAFFTEDGKIAFHNNDADQFNMKSDMLEDYINRYTTNVIVEVNEDNKTVHTTWEYDAEKKEFSKVAGKLEFLPNGNALINFGWSITQDAYKNPQDISINDTNYLNGIVEELDKNNKVLFKGKTKGLIYRVYKVDLYKENMSNFKIENYMKIDGTKNNGQEVYTSQIAKDLKKAKRFEGEFKLQINRAILTAEVEKEDEIDILFVGRNNKTYVYNYKKSNEEEKKAFNSGKYGIQISIPEGEYAVFIKYNENMYDTGLVEII